MDPHEVFTTDRGKFDYDLEMLIDTAAAAAHSTSSSASEVTTPSTTTARTSPPIVTDPRLRNRSLPLRKRSLPDATLVSPKKARLDVSEDNTPATSPTRIQPTGANTIPLGSRKDSNPTWNTLKNAVHRQWDTRKDDLAYEQLVAKRRAERLVNVDRYIPGDPSPPSSPPVRRPSRKDNKPFPFDKLPGKIQDKILTMVLVKEDPLVIDFTWLRPFIHGHCRVPTTTKTFKIDDISYTAPQDWTKLVDEVGLMQKDCSMFTDALELRGNKTRKQKSPCRGLTTGLLRVSKGVHARAAPVFYGENVFHFPWATSAWMQLESFLATIGPINISHLRNIHIHTPLWHRGVQEDFVEGAILDLTSPASRLGVVKPASRDRLLSAIRSTVQALLKAGQLERFKIDLEHGMVTDRWTGRYSNDRHLIAASEAEESVVRKRQGIELLKKLSECVSLKAKPRLTVHHPTATTAKYDLSEFRSRLAGVIREAEKYGWTVDQHLKGGRR
ncbi:hypothetical protein PRZ48_009455 [Zasmidium cellare]|uniref:Uncharacterized protein n=1 Tax=Zasmidium cellare TaxID=395010 RepID=A0ABR0EC58_ZASCE|nr:hypothetical protein PRZ48_009455 [Zasmidium cellare]